jgi:hypothetical protein
MRLSVESAGFSLRRDVINIKDAQAEARAPSGQP